MSFAKSSPLVFSSLMRHLMYSMRQVSDKTWPIWTFIVRALKQPIASVSFMVGVFCK